MAFFACPGKIEEYGNEVSRDYTHKIRSFSYSILITTENKHR